MKNANFHEMKKVIHTKAYINEEGYIDADPESACYIASDSYFESIITHHIEFFDPAYTQMTFYEAAKADLKKIIARGKDNTMLGLAICNIYEEFIDDSEAIEDWLIKEFYEPASNVNIWEWWSNICSKYCDTLKELSLIWKDLSEHTRSSKSLKQITDIYEYHYYSNGGCDLVINDPKYIECRVFLTSGMSELIPPQALFGLIYTERYNYILIAHAIKNSKDNVWKMSDNGINGFISVQDFLDNTVKDGDNGLILVCNEDGIGLQLEKDGVIINYARGKILSEFYIPDYETRLSNWGKNKKGGRD